MDDQVDLLTEYVIAEYLACLGKDRKELSSLRNALARLEEAANEDNPEIDSWVDLAFASLLETNPENLTALEEVA